MSNEITPDSFFQEEFDSFSSSPPFSSFPDAQPFEDEEVSTPEPGPFLCPLPNDPTKVPAFFFPNISQLKSFCKGNRHTQLSNWCIVLPLQAYSLLRVYNDGRMDSNIPAYLVDPNSINIPHP